MDNNMYWTEHEVYDKIARYRKAADHERLVNLALEARQDHRPSLWRRVAAALAVRRQPDPCAQIDSPAATLAQEPC